MESQHNAVIIGTLFGSENKKIIGDDNRHDLARSIGGKQQPSLAEVKTGAFSHKIQEDSILWALCCGNSQAANITLLVLEPPSQMYP